MRKFFITLLAILVVPAAALAASPRDKGDGTLAIKSASGVIKVSAKGTVLGRITDGRLSFTDLNPLDTNVPQVFGFDARVQKGATTTYRGSGMRFRFVGGRYVLHIVGTGVDVAAVGQGTVTLLGLGTVDDGQFSLDGGPFQDVPPTLTTDVFGQAPAASGTLG